MTYQRLNLWDEHLQHVYHVTVTMWVGGKIHHISCGNCFHMFSSTCLEV
jgi:hypothetical protein